MNTTNLHLNSKEKQLLHRFLEYVSHIGKNQIPINLQLCQLNSSQITLHFCAT